MTEPLAASRGLTGRHVLIAFVAFFGIIAAMNLVLVAAAMRSWPGTETASAYRAGQLYNDELRQARAQAARGWLVAPTVAREADGSVQVAVEARDAGGRPLSGREIVATLQRPTDQRADRAVTLTERRPGGYLGTVEALAPGQWELVVDVIETGERTYRLKSRIVLR